MLSDRLGRSIDRAAVNKMTTGKRAIAADELLVLIQALDVEAPTIANDNRYGRSLLPAPESKARAGVLRIAGEVAAGVWREVDLEAAAEYGDMQAIVDPRYPEREQFLLIVRGTSLNRIASDGDFLHCVGIIGSGVEIQPGDLVIVERSKDEGGLVETTAKRVQRLNGTYELHPQSTDPQFQTPVVIPEDYVDEFESIRIIAKVLLISKKP